MKKCKKILALILSLVMLLSAACVGLTASAISAKDQYTGTALSGSMNAADQYELTNAQYASIILDFADKSLAEANIPKMTLAATAGLTIVIDATSINGINGTIVGLAEKLSSLSAFLGDIKNFNFSYFSTSTSRNGTTARDVAFINALVGFLSDSNNSTYICKLVRKGLGTGDGQLNPGSIVTKFIPSTVTAITNDIVGFLKKTLFGSSDASFDTNLATFVSTTINSLDVEMLDGYKYESSDSIYLTVDKLVRCITNWAIKNLQEDTWHIKDLILSAVPDFEKQYPFIDLDGFTKIDWSWEKDGMGTKFVSGTPSTYIVYHLNNIIGTFVNTLIPTFADSTNANYTGGWTFDNSTSSLTTLDANICKAAKFADKVLNGGSLTSAEEASLKSPTKSYVMLLCDAVIRQFLPGLKVEKQDIIDGNICVLAVQGLNEFMNYYIPEKALDDLYTYNEGGAVLNRTKYTETYCKTLYKQMSSQILAKFITAYFPITFSNTSNLDTVLKEICSYFLNTVAKAGELSEGALGTVGSSDTVYTAFDRIILSLNTSGSYVEGCSSNGGRNQTGLLPQGLLPSSYNTSKKIIDLAFSAVENLSVSSILQILIPNTSGTELSTPILPSLACYEIIRIVNVLFPGTWTQKTSSLDTLVTNENLADMLQHILQNLSMNYHVFPALKLVSTIMGLSTAQKRGEASVSLANATTVNSSTVYKEISPLISTSSTSIPADTYFIKVANTSSGINSGYHNASGAEMQDTPYKLKVTAIKCETDSTVTVAGVSSSGTIIDSGSSEGFKISGTMSSASKMLTFLVTYAMSDESGRKYSDEQQSRLYVFAGAPASSTISSNTVSATLPNTIYGTVSMFNSAVGYYNTSSADATYSASAEDTVFPAALVNAGCTFTAKDIGTPASTSATQFNPFSVSIPSSVDITKYYGQTFTITYALKTKDTSADTPTYGSNTTKTISWVLFDDAGLEKLVSKYSSMDLQSGDYSNTTLWNAFNSELLVAKRMIENPSAYSTSASALTTAFTAEVTKLTQAYENLLECASSNNKTLLKARLTEYSDGDKENDVRALYYMWDYTPVSWGRYSSSLSTVSSYYATDESSTVKVSEALRYNEAMSKRLYTSSATEASKSAALTNLTDVRNQFDASNYDATKYTPASYKALTKSFTDADQVISGTGLDGTSASKTSDYADARAAILSALNQLTVQPLDVNDLYTLVQSVQTTYNDNMYYTDEAWAKFESALDDANTAINDPYSLLPESYTTADITAANAKVTEFKSALESAVTNLLANPYVSSLIPNPTAGNSGCVTFSKGEKLIVGTKVIDAEKYIVVPYGIASKVISTYFTMSANVSRYTKDTDGNWNTYSSAGTSVTYQAYKDSTLASTVSNTAKLKTGNVLQVTDGSGNKSVYTIAVTGNDGAAVTATKFKTAYESIANYLPNLLSNTGVSSISNEITLACDLNGDGLIDNTDLVLLKMWANGKYTPANVL